MNSMLCAIRQLTVTYGNDATQPAALLDVNLDVIEGERLAIIGESGSGKSTLARAIAGLLPEGSRVEGGIGWPSETICRNPAGTSALSFRIRRQA